MRGIQYLTIILCLIGSLLIDNTKTLEMVMLTTITLTLFEISEKLKNGGNANDNK